MRRWRAMCGPAAVCVIGVAAAPAEASLTFDGPNPFAAGTAPVSMAAADFNRDGRQDVAVVNQVPSPGVSVLRGNGSGGLLAPLKKALTGDPRGIAAGDLNRDGRPDVVVGDQHPDRILVLLGNGAGGFGTPVAYDAGVNPMTVVVADFNRDGKPDVAATNDEAHTVSVLLGNGSGGLGARTAYFAGLVPRALAAADMDLDGDLDLVAGLNERTVSVLPGDGAGRFEHPTGYDTGEPQASVAVADFTGDGRPDIAVGQPSSGTVSVLLWDGLNWTLSARHPIGGGGTAVRARDMDGDGDADIVASGSAAPWNTSFTVLRNGGAGAFALRQFGSGAGFAGPDDLVVPDLTGDGRPDVAYTTASDGTVTTYRNTSAAGRPYADVVKADKPRGYWRLGERSGTTAADASGFANPGTYLNGVVLGRPGSLVGSTDTAAGFDGVNDWIRVPDKASLDVGDSFTLEAWVRRDTTTGVHQLFNKGGGSFQLVIQPASAGNQVVLRAAGSATVARTVAGIGADGRWHHVVVTKDGGTVQFYLDGQAATTQLVTPKVLANTTAPLAVSSSTRASGAVDGDLDELAVYDSALTNGQVAAHFDAAMGR